MGSRFPLYFAPSYQGLAHRATGHLSRTAAPGVGGELEQVLDAFNDALWNAPAA